MIVGRIVYAGSKLALSTSGTTLRGNCALWKAKWMWTSIVICRWIDSWNARAPFSAPWPLVIYFTSSAPLISSGY